MGAYFFWREPFGEFVNRKIEKRSDFLQIAVALNGMGNFQEKGNGLGLNLSRQGIGAQPIGEEIETIGSGGNQCVHLNLAMGEEEAIRILTLGKCDHMGRKSGADTEIQGAQQGAKPGGIAIEKQVEGGAVAGEEAQEI